jgi:hypothetical protein
MRKYIDREDLVEIINKRIQLTNPDEQEWVKDECIRLSHCLSAISPKEFYKSGIKDFAERLVFEIVNKPSEFNAAQGTTGFLNGLAHRQLEILDIVEKISKELRGESENG